MKKYPVPKNKKRLHQIRRFLSWKSIIGSIPNTGDSVKEVREIRKKLSEEPFDIDYINSL